MPRIRNVWDLSESGGAEERVHQSVDGHVGVGMTKEPKFIRDLDAAKHERPSGGKSVNVESLAYPYHQMNCSRKRMSLS